MNFTQLSCFFPWINKILIWKLLCVFSGFLFDIQISLMIWNGMTKSIGKQSLFHSLTFINVILSSLLLLNEWVSVWCTKESQPQIHTPTERGKQRYLEPAARAPVQTQTQHWHLRFAHTTWRMQNKTKPGQKGNTVLQLCLVEYTLQVIVYIRKLCTCA